MTSQQLINNANAYLNKLCVEISTRRVGSAGNREAADFFARTVSAQGWEVRTPAFNCIDWTQSGAELVVGGEHFEVQVSPYSLGGMARSKTVVVNSVDELEAADLGGRIVVLRGDIAKEQLMPKNFVFYNPDEHKRIIALLEAKHPAAIITATGRDPEMAGAVYPFPLIEDGDFDIPSVYTTEEDGLRLTRLDGSDASLEIRAERLRAEGCNIVARKGGQPDRRVVLFAHIDAKEGTPGATDNATGVIVLLLLAELLAEYRGRLCLELVALNGEDYYSAPGEMLYLQENEGKFEEILLGINLDGAGFHEGKSAYSLYDCPADLTSTIQQVFSAHPEIVEGEPWYQSDHGLFLMNQRPALAITSERFIDLLSQVVHTPKDNPLIVDAAKLVRIAEGLRDVLLALEESAAR